MGQATSPASYELLYYLSSGLLMGHQRTSKSFVVAPSKSYPVPGPATGITNKQYAGPGRVIAFSQMQFPKARPNTGNSLGAYRPYRYGTTGNN